MPSLFCLCRCVVLLGALLLGAARVATAQTAAGPAAVRTHALTACPRSATSTAVAASLRQLDAMLASAVTKARQTLPQTKQRFQATQSATDEVLFLTTRLYDTDGTFEQVVVRVQAWRGTTVRGTIANELNLVAQYAQGQVIEFPEKAVLDWTLSHADGSEEGNFIGQLLDARQE